MYRRISTRMAALAAMLAVLLAAVAPGLAVPPTGPGAVPDYFGTPNWAFSPPLAKFVDPLPGLWDPRDRATIPEPAKCIPLAVPDTLAYPGSDYYEIELREYKELLHQDLNPTTLRGYVQVNYGTGAGGTNSVQPAGIHYLGPLIVATKGRAVRVKFTNKLNPEVPPLTDPVTPSGKLFVPVDTTIMGAGEYDIDFDPLSKSAAVIPRTTGHFTENRATLHLHGGRTPWISDGTPHQWITPADEMGDNDNPAVGRFYSQGVSVVNVPDMPEPGDGSQTFYWTNQQSSRLMFYHDHAWGITRLNVYVGEAAGYLITDDMEQTLIAPAGPLAGLGYGTPLIVQDKTFVDAATIKATDPTWNWGTGAVNPGEVTSIRVTATGSGYTTPTVNVTDGVGGPDRGALATATVDAGRIVGITLTSGGTGYADPRVVIVDAGSDGLAAATATVADARPPVTGDLWWPHVYMPAQNPYNPDFSGINAMGRWHYGPWFWPPTPLCYTSPQAVPPYCVDFIEAPNPYYDCYFATETKAFPPYDAYTSDGPCLNPEQPPYIPGTPDVSWGAEAFLDTMVVNGTAYPTHEVEPKQYRFRVLNAAHDRFLNLQLYQAVDKTTYTLPTQTLDFVGASPADLTEVAMVPAGPRTLCTASLVTDCVCDDPHEPAGCFPPLWPTDGREGGVPDPATAGPAFIQIGSEGGFLPAPVLLENQPVQWNLDPTMFNVGNVLQQRDGGGTLILGPAERADVIVDFSKFAGKTLILYNDAPTAFPALDPHYDYYTLAPDRTDIGAAPSIPPGVGPNIRTVMQIRVKPDCDPLNARCDSTAPTNDHDQATLAALTAAFKSGGATPFATHQDPIIVGQKEYGNALGATGAYNRAFPATYPNWGLSRISDTTLRYMGVDGLLREMPMEPKAIHDEMGGTFDNYGRMSAKLGLEVAFSNAAISTFALQNYVDPPTEFIDPAVDLEGVQIWKITHNGVDTHPIHFHLFDVQLINRVGWDGFIRKPDPNELGWKDTVRMAPLEDTIVALRPIAPQVPFGLPNSWRPLNPETYLGSMMGFSQVDPATGGALAPANRTENTFYDFGWEYVWHCHILSHEENDMMRSIVFAAATNVPQAPLSLTATPGPGSMTLTWVDTTPAATAMGNTDNEIGFLIERRTGGGTFVTYAWPLANETAFIDTAVSPGVAYAYRILAYNQAGNSPWSNVAGTQSAIFTGTFVINGDAPFTNSLAANLAINYAVDPGTIASMRFSTNGGTSWVTGFLPYAPTRAITLAPAGNGVKSVTVQFRDAAGNLSPKFSDTILYDATAPTGSILINNGAESTVSTAVTLNLTAADAGGSGVASMRFRNRDTDPYTAWEPFQITKAWTLVAGLGTKKVSVQFQDGAGNISDANATAAGAQPYTDTINLVDAIAPTGSILINNAAASTATTAVTLNLAAADTGGSGVASMRFRNLDTDPYTAWEPFQITKAWTLVAGAGTKKVSVQFQDGAGNISDANPAAAGQQGYTDTITLQ